MRLGLDIRRLGSAQRVAVAQEADRLGLWAVLCGGDKTNAATVAAELATQTDHVHLAMFLSAETAHPSTLAEEVAIVDHLSRRRALAIVDGSEQTVQQVRDLLEGRVVNGTALAPPPAQTVVPVWSAAELSVIELSGDLDQGRSLIDHHRDNGTTHLFVTWPGPLLTLARHLAMRAATPDFPQIVADYPERSNP